MLDSKYLVGREGWENKHIIKNTATLKRYLIFKVLIQEETRPKTI